MSKRTTVIHYTMKTLKLRADEICESCALDQDKAFDNCDKCTMFIKLKGSKGDVKVILNGATRKIISINTSYE